MTAEAVLLDPSERNRRLGEQPKDTNLEILDSKVSRCYCPNANGDNLPKCTETAAGTLKKLNQV
jgi:serine kinase of HPr protein (carbohydrate metabolism regulator)